MQQKVLKPVLSFWLVTLVFGPVGGVLNQSAVYATAPSSELGSATGSEATSPLTFERHIRPILKAHCLHCHGEDGEKEGGMDFRQVRLMKESGAIDSSSPGESLLLTEVRSGRMPKNAKALPPHDIELIEAWLKQGSPTARPEPEVVPDFFITEEERDHWAFQPISKPSVPSNGEANPIDAFIADELHMQNLTFAQSASRRTLIRRASLDLIGLPPSPAEVEHFVNDSSATAWENAIERLLASPHYGERWGRHWLDVAGYADSFGGLLDRPRDHMWHYRDYVVRSINADKTWDVFIQEQLAGDELAKLNHANANEVLQDRSQWDRLIGTGFLRLAADPTDHEPPDPIVAEETVIADNLKIIGSSLLGLTVGCAQCHDHRFDPISHVDYHRLRAVIEPVFDRTAWRGPRNRQYEAYTPEEHAERVRIEAEAAAVDQKRIALIDREYAKYLEDRMKDVPEEIKPSVRTAWNTPVGKRTEADKELLVKYDCNFEKADHLRFLLDRGKEEAERVAFQEEAKELRETMPSRVIMASTEVPGRIPETRRFHRGDYRQPKEAIEPGDLAIFGKGNPIETNQTEGTTSSGRRLAYAKWLTSGQHPIVPRVLVNRFWFHHFGQGLNPVVADFGTRTPRPKYGDLLDWLAATFVERGWSLKDFHRMVMTSKTYQQSSTNSAAEKIDANNTLYARFSLKRLEAEAVRDSLLAVCGNLKEDLGGKPLLVARRPEGGVVIGKELSNQNNGVVHTVVSLGDAAHRRSIYVQAIRNRPLTVLQTFDLPMMAPNCNQRAVTTVAPQSLMMLNDTFVLEQSDVFAKSLLQEHPESREQQIASLWLRSYGEPVSEAEASAANAFVEAEEARQRTRDVDANVATERALAALCQVVFASNRFLYAP